MKEIQLYIEEAKELMQKAVNHTASELVKVRAGKAMPNLLDGIMVNYYGSPTPLSQVTYITTPDARTLSIKPLEKNLSSEIKNAIIKSNSELTYKTKGVINNLSLPTITSR